jgi:hypothetical protein
VEHASEVLAVEGDVVIVHWNVRARSGEDAVLHQWDGILLLRFAVDGRCAEHREWFAMRDLTG